MSPTDHLTERERERLTRAPQWMRDLALRLSDRLDAELRRADALADALADPHGSTTTLDPYGARPTPIGVNPELMHTFGNGRQVRVELCFDRVRVAAQSGRVLVQPEVANSVAVIQHDF